jgi:hypothetical protein
VSQSERSHNTRAEPFSLTVDQYGRLWLRAKLEGLQIAVDLAEKEQAFQIMAATMAEQKFDYHPFSVAHDGLADNDDEMRR